MAMNEVDKPQFLSLLDTLAAHYGTQMQPKIALLYWHALKDLSWEAIERACYAHLRDAQRGRWMPKPADLIAQVEVQYARQAQSAWEKVDYAVRKIGSYNTVAFDDPVIHVAIKQLAGWPKLCSLTEREMASYQVQFEQCYAKFCVSPPVHYPPYLAGILPGDTQLELVGDKAKAKAIAGGLFNNQALISGRR